MPNAPRVHLGRRRPQLPPDMAEFDEIERADAALRRSRQTTINAKTCDRERARDVLGIVARIALVAALMAAGMAALAWGDPVGRLAADVHRAETQGGAW